MLERAISRYRIIKKLGKGGMGEVFLAQDESLDRRIALKCLSPELQKDPVAHKRFLREAKSAAALDHPYICTIHEVCEFEGQEFIVMEYVEGQTLQERLHQGPIPMRECLLRAIEIAEALERAHDKGIVHRDIKPSNIMLTTGGHVKVLDFGLAKQTQASGGAPAEENTLTALTETGGTPGTMAYMSPEQLRGLAVDARSDIFSFGVLLYEMLTGVHPFREKLPVVTAAGILNKEPAPLSDRIENPSGTLQQTLSRMLAKDLAQRYTGIREITADLRQAIMELDQAESGGQLAEAKNFRRNLSKPVFLIPASVVLVALISFVLIGMARNRKVLWARDTALPEIARLAATEDYTRAFDLAVEAERYLADDPNLTRLWEQVSRNISIDSLPGGAEVCYRPFGRAGDSWRRLASTPIRDARIPLGSLEWQISKPGYARVQDVGLLAPYLTIRDRAPQVPYVYVLEMPESLPDGMSRVSTRGPQLLGHCRNGACSAVRTQRILDRPLRGYQP